MIKTQWRQVGVAVLSRSGWALNISIDNEWYSIKISELRKVLNGWRKTASVSAPTLAYDSEEEPW